MSNPAKDKKTNRITVRYKKPVHELNKEIDYLIDNKKIADSFIPTKRKKMSLQWVKSPYTIEMNFEESSTDTVLTVEASEDAWDALSNKPYLLLEKLSDRDKSSFTWQKGWNPSNDYRNLDEIIGEHVEKVIDSKLTTPSTEQPSTQSSYRNQKQTKEDDLAVFWVNNKNAYDNVDEFLQIECENILGNEKFINRNDLYRRILPDAAKRGLIQKLGKYYYPKKTL